MTSDYTRTTQAAGPFNRTLVLKEAFGGTLSHRETFSAYAGPDYNIAQGKGLILRPTQPNRSKH